MTRDKKTGRFYKGFIPWNKGLTKEDPRVRKNTELSSSTFRKKYAEGEIKQAWNKDLTKNDDSRIMGVSKALTGIKRRQESIEKSTPITSDLHRITNLFHGLFGDFFLAGGSF